MFNVAVAYLLLPTTLFLIGFSTWPVAAVVAIGTICSLYFLWREPAAGNGADKAWAVFAAVAMVATFLSGIVPPLAQNSDWLKHYALFNLMTDQTWPPKVEIDGAYYSLRYPLSWYAVPSLVGKALGKWAVLYAAFLWTAAGLFIALRISFKGIGGAKAATMACLVFLLFSGADILGYAITRFTVGPTFHIEWWAEFAESPSNVTSLFWTPQHAIPAWIATALFLRYPERSVRNGMTIAAAIAGWSPFVLIGMAPIVVIALSNAGVRHVLTPQNVVAAVLLIVPAVFFLSHETGGIPVGVTWGDPHFTFPTLIIFLLLEFWIIGALVISANRFTASTSAWISACLLFLTALALTRVGARNDLMMRGSIPSLALIAIFSAETVVRRRFTLAAPLIIVLTVGTVTAFGEIFRGFIDQRIPATGQLSIKSVIDADLAFLPQYLVAD